MLTVETALEWLVLAFAAVAGLCVGSFVNLVIYRGPALWGLIEPESPRGDFIAPRSYCPACRTPIPALRLVPVISYAVQRGQCAACGARIAIRYPAVEIFGALIASGAILSFGLSWPAALAASFGWALLTLAFIDLETGYLPDAITLPLAGAGLAVNLTGVFAAFGEAIIGAAAGFGSFWIIGAAFQKLRGKEGLGLGDAKLLAAIGAWAGWIALPAVVFIGAVATLLFVAGRRIVGNKIIRDAEIPFGPGLAAAGFIVLLVTPFVDG